MESGEYQGQEKRSGEDRRARKMIEVSIGGFDNGAGKSVRSLKRWLRGGVSALVVGIASAGTWVVTTGHTDATQTKDIAANSIAIDSVNVLSQLGDEQNELATIEVSKALADGLAEISETVSGIIANQRAMQAEQVAQRRDIERLRDSRGE